MAKVTNVLSGSSEPVFISDFTPPRGSDPALLEGAGQLSKGDFVAVAYNPGKLVRLDSVTAAFQIKQRFGQDVVFNLSPRDMNRIALQSRLLGAASLGLENVLVLQGDPISERDNASTVSDYRSTGLIAAARELNEGTDYRGGKLRSATDLCIGASMDPGRELQSDAKLAHRKAQAGADFFVTQPVWSFDQIEAFEAAYQRQAGEMLKQPVFWGVQLLTKDGVLFAGIPDEVRAQIEAGRDGVEIALEVYEALRSHAVTSFYVVAPILRGGARDYESAGRLLDAVRK